MAILTDNVYKFFIAGRQKIIGIFKIIYLLIVFFIISALLISPQNEKMLPFFYRLGITFGRGALLAFILTLIPGIGERLGIRNKFLSILRIFRRYIGILMYLFTLAHLSLVKILLIASLKGLLFQKTFEIMGTISLFILFFLFVTSNDISLNRLKLNWYRLHRFIYLATFFIFLHVALQRLSIWSVLMGLVIIFQVISFVVVYLKTKSLTGGRPV